MSTVAQNPVSHFEPKHGIAPEGLAPECIALERPTLDYAISLLSTSSQSSLRLDQLADALGADSITVRWPATGQAWLEEQFGPASPKLQSNDAQPGWWQAVSSRNISLSIHRKPTEPFTAAEESALTLTLDAMGHWLERSSVWSQAANQADIQDRFDDRAKVTAKLAHDFGNYLTGILGFTELAMNQLNRTASPAIQAGPLQRYLGEVHQSAKNGAQWVHRLQTLSRRSQPMPTKCQPGPVLLGEANRARSTWPNTIKLETNFPATLPQVAIVTEMLTQLVAQLLDNARESIASAGSVQFAANVVELTKDSGRQLLGSVAPGAFVEITIADSGTGISPQNLARMWQEPFFSTKPRRRGLGVAVVHGIVQTFRGGFKFESAPGMGTKASVYLPLAE